MSKTNHTLESFAPVLPDNAELLILGSMPGVASLQANQYYAHPRNGFWKILQAIYGGGINSYEERLALLHIQRIGVWDTLKHCERPGSLDSAIASGSVICNDFNDLLAKCPTIKLIAFNGKASEKWFRKLVLPELQHSLTLASLPSSSPAMASLTIDEKTAQWRQALSTV